MNIIICEDERYWSEMLSVSIEKWAVEKGISIYCNHFTLPQELLYYLEAHADSDVLFLDISLGEQVIDGMTLAKRIRKMGNSIPIIFVTIDSMRAADGYLVEAMGFLLKPVNYSRLKLFLDRIVKRQKDGKSIKVMVEGHTKKIHQNDIIYVEIKNHTITYHTIKNDIEFRGTLGEVLVALGEEFFVQIHRSYVIALNKVESIKTTSPHSVILKQNNNLIDLPVSRKYINKLLEAYSDDILEKMI